MPGIPLSLPSGGGLQRWHSCACKGPLSCQAQGHPTAWAPSRPHTALPTQQHPCSSHPPTAPRFFTESTSTPPSPTGRGACTSRLGLRGLAPEPSSPRPGPPWCTWGRTASWKLPPPFSRPPTSSRRGSAPSLGWRSWTARKAVWWRCAAPTGGQGGRCVMVGKGVGLKGPRGCGPRSLGGAGPQARPEGAWSELLA